jgi:hypothetical protein
MFLRFKTEKRRDASIGVMPRWIRLEKFVMKLVAKEIRLAIWFQRKSEKLSNQQKKFSVLLFSMIACGVSIHTITSNLGSHSYMGLERINIPKYLIQQPKKNLLDKLRNDSLMLSQALLGDSIKPTNKSKTFK